MRKTFRNPFILFSMIYGVLALGLCVGSAVFGRSLVQAWDAFDQHYPLMLYIRRFYQSVVSGIFHGSFTIPTWDLSLGYGQGILPTLYFYGIADPFNFPLVFIPESAVIYYYGALLLIRPYLAGLAFISFCRHKNHFGLATVLGALLYILSGFGLYAMSVHPFFINAMIGLPLMLIGFDYVCEGKMPYLWILTTFILACQGFYFTYMITLMVIIYAIVCAVCTDEIGVRTSFCITLRNWLRASGFYLLGLGMAMAFFLPGVIAYFQSGRFLLEPERSLFFYSASTMFDKLKHLFIIDYDDDVLATTIVIIPAFVWLLRKRKTQLRLLVCAIIAILAFFVPAIAYCLNGFAFSARHIFGIAFVLSYVIVCALPNLGELFSKHKDIVTKIASVLIVLTLLCNLGKDGLTILRTMRVGNALDEFSDSVIGDFADSADKDTTLSRIDADAKDCYFYNIGPAKDLSTTRIYASIIPYNMASGLQTLEVASCYNPQQTYGLDARTSLETLAGVKYFVTDASNPSRVPYSYAYIGSTDAQTQIYENPYALGLGYVYTHRIDTTTWEDADAIQKSDLLLQGVVSENSFSNLPLANTINHESEALPYTISYDESQIQISNGTVQVLATNAMLTLEFDGAANSETYLILSEVHCSSKITGSVLTHTGESLNLSILPPNDVYYSGKTQFTYNLGYAKTGQSKVSISFSAPCTLKMGAMELRCLSMTDYTSEISALGASKLINTEKTSTGLSGEIDVQESGVLCLAIPYADGYTVQIDGESVPYACVNLSYVGVSISEGHHSVMISYEAPGTKIGRILSGIGLVVFIYFVVRDMKKRSALNK